MQLRKIPATIVTGFLGSGKTTLLRRVLTESHGLRVAVIVNEFGAMDVDTDLVRQCSIGCEDETASENTTAGVYELANGCICCTVQEEFHPVLQQLIERKDDIDHILIETSGLALPKPLVQAFSWPEIRNNCTVDAVITVVDGPAVAAGQFAQDPDAVQQLRLSDPSLDHTPELAELFEDQLSAADFVVINKSADLDAAALENVEAYIRQRLPREVKTFATNHCQLDLDLLLRVGAAAEDHIDHIHTHHDHHHDHEEDHHHAHDVFSSCVVDVPVMPQELLAQALKTLVAEFTIYRIKGHAAIEGKPMRLLVQGVGQRFDMSFDRRWADGETVATRLVFIGKDLQVDKLQARLETLAKV